MRPDRSPSVSVLVGVGALVAAGVLYPLARAGRTPDVGSIGSVRASPPVRVTTRTLGRGETLGEMLSDVVGGREHYRILLAFREEADPRRIRPGAEIRLEELVEDGELRGVDVRLDADRTVRLTRSPAGWSASSRVTPVRVDTLLVAGRIEDNLWNSVMENPDLEGIPAPDRLKLVWSLDAVYQWAIDFSREIQGDEYYRVAFEREVRPDGSQRGQGRVLAAEFYDRNEYYPAVWFDPNGDGDGEHYDLRGRSLKKAFLRKPLEYRYISSGYSGARYHPILKRWRSHRGVDYRAGAGTPVQVTADGVITHRGRDGGYGNMVEVRHPNGYRTRYAHLRAFKRGQRTGNRVRQGEVVGFVGCTGLCTGSHLHYEIRIPGKGPVDPTQLELPPGDPVPSDDRERWLRESARRLVLLNELPQAPSLLRMAARTAREAADRPGPGGGS